MWNIQEESSLQDSDIEKIISKFKYLLKLNIAWSLCDERKNGNQ